MDKDLKDILLKINKTLEKVNSSLDKKDTTATTSTSQSSEGESLFTEENIRRAKEIRNAQQEIYDLEKLRQNFASKTNKSIGTYLSATKDVLKNNVDILRLEKKIQAIDKKATKDTERKKSIEKELSRLLAKKTEGTKKLTQEEEDRIDLLKDELDILEGSLSVTKDRLETEKDILTNSKKKNSALSSSLSITKSLANTVVDSLVGGFKKMVDLGQESIKLYNEQERGIRNIGQSLGMSLKNMTAMRTQLYKAAPFMAKLGIDSTTMAKAQSEISKSMGGMVQFSATQSILMSEMMKATGMSEESTGSMYGNLNKVGLSIRQTNKFMEETLDKSEEIGLNGMLVINDFNENFEKMQGFNFKNGVKGMMQMSKYSRELKISTSSALDLADKLFTPENAVNISANLQALGGGFASLGNAYDLMYKARNNPEKLIKDISEATRGMYNLNTQTGELQIADIDVQRVKMAAEQLGIQSSELFEAGKKLFKMDKVKRDLFNLKGSKEEVMDMQEFLANTSMFGSDGRLKITLDGVERDIRSLSTGEIKLAMQKDKKNRLDQRALSNISSADFIKNLMDAGFASTFQAIEKIDDGLLEPLKNALGERNGLIDEGIGKLQKFLTDTAESLKGWVKNLLGGEKYVENIKNWIKIIAGNLDVIAGVTAAIAGLALAIKGFDFVSKFGGVFLKGIKQLKDIFKKSNNNNNNNNNNSKSGSAYKQEQKEKAKENSRQNTKQQKEQASRENSKSKNSSTGKEVKVKTNKTNKINNFFKTVSDKTKTVVKKAKDFKLPKIKLGGLGGLLAAINGVSAFNNFSDGNIKDGVADVFGTAAQFNPVGRAVTLGTDLTTSLIPDDVVDKENKNKLSNVSAYAGTGALIGSLVATPGLGTAIGGGVGAAVGLTVEYWDEIVSGTKSLVNSTSELFNKADSSIEKEVSQAKLFDGGYFDSLVNNTSNFFTGIGTSFIDLTKSAGEMGADIYDGAKKMRNKAILSVIKGVGTISEWGKLVGREMKSILNLNWLSMSGLFTGITNFFLNKTDKISEVITNVREVISEKISSIFTSIFDSLTVKFNDFNPIDFITNLFSGFKDGISSLFTIAGDILGEPGEFVSNIMTDMFSSIGNSIEDIFSSSDDSDSDIFDIIKLLGGMVGFSKGGYTGDGNKNEIAGFVHKGEYVIPNGITRALGLDKASSRPGSIFNSSQNMPSTVVENNVVSNDIKPVKMEVSLKMDDIRVKVDGVDSGSVESGSEFYRKVRNEVMKLFNDTYNNSNVDTGSNSFR